MPDSTELALMTASLPAALTFVFQRVEHLLSKRGEQPENDVTPPDALVGTLQLPLQPDTGRLREQRDQLEALRDAVADYAHGDVPAHPSPALLRNVARLRAALEDIYGQHLTFRGRTGRTRARSYTRKATPSTASSRAWTPRRSPETPVWSRTSARWAVTPS